MHILAVEPEMTNGLAKTAQIGIQLIGKGQIYDMCVRTYTFLQFQEREV